MKFPIGMDLSVTSLEECCERIDHGSPLYLVLADDYRGLAEEVVPMSRYHACHIVCVPKEMLMSPMAWGVVSGEKSVWTEPLL